MKKSLTSTLLLIAINFVAIQVMADMYKWVDKNGVVHFSDNPPASEKVVETLETSVYREPPPKPDRPVSEPVAGQRDENAGKADGHRSNQVEIYTTSWCRYCKKAIALLRANHIEYKAYDIEKDPKAAARMKALGGSGGVPFAIINGKKAIGFF